MSYHPAGWVARGGADNALATATKAAEDGREHIVYGVTASFSGAAAGKLLTIKDGTDVVFQAYVTNQLTVTFERGLVITRGNACSAELAASGTGLMLGHVNLHGITVG